MSKKTIKYYEVEYDDCERPEYFSSKKEAMNSAKGIPGQGTKTAWVLRFEVQGPLTKKLLLQLLSGKNVFESCEYVAVYESDTRDVMSIEDLDTKVYKVYDEEMGVPYSPSVHYVGNVDGTQ